MLTEECVACGVDVPLSAAVHMLVNPKGDEEVSDGYLCRSCYEEHLQPILPPDEQDLVEDVDPDADEGDGGGRPDDVDPPGSDGDDVDGEVDAGEDATPGEA